MSNFKTIDDLDVSGKRVLLRADLNVPMQDGKPSDTTRIDRTVPTIKELTARGAKVIIVTHFGRPKGEVVPDLTVKPVADAMASALGCDVAFATDTIGDNAKAVVAAMNDGDVAMLENVRFHAGETDNDDAFASELASLGDFFVNDAFSTAHRAHASTEALARKLPAAAGRLMQAELEALGSALGSPVKPVAAVVGGAKVSTKMEVLGNLSKKVDMIIIGGGMANTFLYAQGHDVGISLCEKDMADEAKKIIATAAENGCEIVLPVDVVVASQFAANAANEAVDIDAIPSDKMALDIGPKSIADVEARLATCKTLVWNGPFGAFEIEPFDVGTNSAAQAAARLTKAGQLTSVAGGGDTVAALVKAGAADDFSYISTAGGAFLEWIEGKTLPGVAALEANA
ncbi:MAG: phosphoglycerate kinase [Rhodospirillaceae bacterium]|nr:MAG: phosphoglycerate kinase [Rhodospirillaceae bacterium]